LHVELKRRKRNGIKSLALCLPLRRPAKESFKVVKIEALDSAKTARTWGRSGDHDALHRDSRPSSEF